MPLKAVFLDIDGTLVDSNELHVAAWDEAFRKAGHRVEKAGIRTQIGKGADQLIPALAPGLDPKTRDDIAGHHADIFATRYLRQVRPLPGGRDLMEMLHAKGIRVVLASSAKEEEVAHYVELMGVKPFVDATISADDVAHSKPAGDIFAAALAKVFPLAASETLAIGDTIYDVQSARRSQIRTIALRSGGASEEELGNAGAAFVYASVKALVDDFDGSPLAVI